MSLRHWPSVSVIISTYNRGATYLSLALQSVFDQTYSKFEVIVVDDASDDNGHTADTLERFSKKALQRNIEFRAFRLSKNSGYQCIPKNMGIYNACGDYIAYLDDDNEWTHDHLTELMKPFKHNIELDLTYCWRMYIGESGQEINPHPPEWDKACQSIMANANCIDTSDIVHSRGLAYAVYDRYGDIWCEDDMRFGDLTLLKRIILSGGRGQLVPKELTKYRWHGKNLMLTRPVMNVSGVDVEDVQDHV